MLELLEVGSKYSPPRSNCMTRYTFSWVLLWVLWSYSVVSLSELSWVVLSCLVGVPS